MTTIITILIATAISNSVSVLSTSVLNNNSSSEASKSFSPFDLQKTHQKPDWPLLTDGSKKDHSSEGVYSSERRQWPIRSQVPASSRSRTVSKVDEPETNRLSKISISAESRQRPLTGHIHDSSNHRIALRVDDMKTGQQTEGGISAESRQRPMTGHIHASSNHRIALRVDDIKTGQQN
ncbi:hypothetical protein AVEN_83335-1 [Araneus ventricosus]|uniref:Secreted protein n=1 Tax=Araneus ventricosus TaxID=182803 RepID=A0A4Y2QF82_ARAVE|nr:hypothetical protein AVEN_83335-1 [Araneus ventricosus]